MSVAFKPIVEDFEKELTCTICNEIFTDPKTLACLHSYCCKCIVERYERSGNQVTKQFDCPICHTRIHVPDGDASKLRPSFYLESLLQSFNAMKSKTNQPGIAFCVSCEKPVVVLAFCTQCNGMMCTVCVDAHKNMKHLREEHKLTLLTEFQQTKVDTFIKSQMLCQEKSHEKHKLEYFCQEKGCRRCICQKCATLFHQDHKMLLLEEAAEMVEQEVQQDMNKVSQLKEKCEGELEQSKRKKERIQSEIELTKKEVHEAEEKICKIVRKHTTDMVNKLNQHLEEQTLANRREQRDIEQGIGRLSELRLQWKTTLRRGVSYDIIESKEAVQQRCNNLLERPSILGAEPLKQDMRLSYVTNPQVMQSLKDIGNIVKADPSQCTMESLSKVILDFDNDFDIVTRNMEGEVCPTRIEFIDVKIKDVHGREVLKDVFEEQTGKCHVKFKAKKAGAYDIQVNIGGVPIKNSPQHLEMLQLDYRIVGSFGGHGDGKGEFEMPQSIAVSDNGEIAIADYCNNRVQIFNLKGEYLREFGRKLPKMGKGELYLPFGVVFNEDRIIVSDQPDKKSGRIQEFDLNGTYKRTVYRHELGFVPCGMCVNDDKNIAVCCKGNKELDIKPSIKVFGKQGDLMQEFGGTEDMNEPLYITYGNEKYFVSCYDKDCVCVFDKNGVFLYKFGEEGIHYGEFLNMGGLAVFEDIIFVCDCLHGCFRIFTQKGKFIRSIKSLASPGWKSPIDLVVTSHDGRVFILDQTDKRVDVLG